MTRDIINIQKKVETISAEDFGTEIINSINEMDNYPEEVGKEVIRLILNAKSAHEFQLLNDMFVAITGWNIVSVIENMEGGEII